MREKDARSLLEAELMEERARRNHMYYIAGKIKRSCQELHQHNKDLRYLFVYQFPVLTSKIHMVLKITGTSLKNFRSLLGNPGISFQPF